MSASINQHVSRSELNVSVFKLEGTDEITSCVLILKGDGVEITVFLNTQQLEEIAGKTMAYLMPELASK